MGVNFSVFDSVELLSLFFSLLCVKLSAVSQLLLAPAMSTPEAVFKELQDRFDYDEAITKEILSSGVTSLSELRFYCSNEEDRLLSRCACEARLVLDCAGREGS